MTPYEKLVESLATSGITDFAEIERISEERNIAFDSTFDAPLETAITDELTPATKE